MKFPYNTLLSEDPQSGDYLVFRRPEIPITISHNQLHATLIGLVDTGSDFTIFPKSVAEYLQLPLVDSPGTSSAFGGHEVKLLEGSAMLQLATDDQTLAWPAEIRFCDFARAADETVILGHYGFLDFFTAIFDGKEGILTLVPNDEFPLAP